MNPLCPQPTLDIPAADISPMAPMEAVMYLGRKREDDVLSAIDQGKLAWAFNIASPGTRRRELRILTDTSLAAYLTKVNLGVVPHCQTWEQAITAILPKPTLTDLGTSKHQTIRAVQLTMRFVCNQDLVANLLKTGELTAAPFTVGVKVSPFIDFSSVVAFLHRRCLSAANSVQRTEVRGQRSEI